MDEPIENTRMLSALLDGIQTIRITKHKFINSRDVLYQRKRAVQEKQKLFT